MEEYEVILPNGIVTTMLLDEETAKQYDAVPVKKAAEKAANKARTPQNKSTQ